VSTAPIRVLVVDDEPLARRRIRALLRPEPDIEVVGECGGGAAAVAALCAQPAPELVFLDVEMPGLNAFEVIDAVGVERMPAVVFVTAYDHYAVRAFEVHALDYLLKPFERERFRAALQRARQRLRPPPGAGAEAPPPAIRLGLLVDDVMAGRPFGGRLAIRGNGRITFLETAQLDWLEADGNLVRLHAGERVYTARQSLGVFEAQLPSPPFLRIHRSTIVNLDRVREMEPWFGGDYTFVLHDHTRLTSGKSYRDRVRTLVERAL
jgi:two-component system, LytTR family, response regulator